MGNRYSGLLRRHFLLGAGSSLLLSSAVPTSAIAQTSKRLRIGLAAAFTTADPHAANSPANNGLNFHYADPVVDVDYAQRPIPALASKWNRIDDTNWEFTLREGVKFSDGTPLSVEDVKASIARVNAMPAGSLSYQFYSKKIKAVHDAGPGKFIVETTEPDPLLLYNLSRLRICSARFKDAPSSRFDAGEAALGTGPYVLKEFEQGNFARLVRNPHYWDGSPDWEEVILRVIPNEGARLASLLANEQDIIAALPIDGMDRVKSNRNFQVLSGPGLRTVYLGFDQQRDVTPYVTGHDGKPLKANPFKDLRVRQALSRAIQRDAIVERILGGAAVPSTQFLQPGNLGASKKLKPIPYDPQGAKELLAAAGYPTGFKLNLQSSGEQLFVNDSAVAQAIAQMFSRVGVATQVDILPRSIYYQRLQDLDTSAFIQFWGSNTGETGTPLTATCATFDKDKNFGTNNFGRYSNPKLDALLAKASTEVDEAVRDKLLSEASEIAVNDVAFVPLHQENLVYGGRKGISCTPRPDNRLLAQTVKPSN